MYNEFDDCFHEPESDELLLRMMEEEEDCELLDAFDDHDLDLLDSFDDDEFPF